MLQSLHCLGGPLLDSLQYVHDALVLGTPGLDPALQVWPHQCWAEGKDLLPALLLMQPWYRWPPIPQGHIAGSWSARSTHAVTLSIRPQQSDFADVTTKHVLSAVIPGACVQQPTALSDVP